jgi:ABC-type Na+ efflux pump permease subunit
MDKDLLLQIVVAVITTILVFLILMTVVNSMMDVTKMQERFNASFCSNLTKETFNTTPNHDWCVYNESSEKYELGQVQLLNAVVT